MSRPRSVALRSRSGLLSIHLRIERNTLTDLEIISQASYPGGEDMLRTKFCILKSFSRLLFQISQNLYSLS